MRLLTKLAYAAPSVGFAGISLPLLIYLPTFYATQRAVPIAAVGAAFLIIRLLDIGFDPIVGALMDRTNAKIGRFKLWMAAGTPLLLLAVWGLFMPPAGAGLIYLIVCLIGVYAAWSICFVAQLGWGVALSNDYAERNSIFAWWQMAYLVGTLTISALPLLPALKASPELTVPAMGTFILIAAPLGVLLALFVVPEPGTGPRPHARLVDYFRLIARPNVARLLVVDLLIGMAIFNSGALFFFYFGAVRGIGFGQAAILLFATNLGSLCGAWLWSRLATRIEKHRAAMVAFGCYALFLALVNFAPMTILPVALGVMLVFGATLSAGPVLVRSMLADVGDEEKLRHGVDHTGLLSALFSNSNKIGAAIGPAISFVILGLVGFQPKAPHQTEAALHMLSGLAIWAPAAVGLLCVAIIAGHKLTRVAHARVREELARAPL